MKVDPREMLNDLLKDKEGDLWKLSHGHDSQWRSFIDAVAHGETIRLKGVH